MESTFQVARAFNQQLDWDTSKVKKVNFMFWSAEAFNQPLVWDVSAATTMYRTFQGAQAFNQPGIADWDVARVGVFDEMFDNTALADDACSKQLVAEAWNVKNSGFTTWAGTVGCVFRSKSELAAAVSG